MSSVESNARARHVRRRPALLLACLAIVLCSCEADAPDSGLFVLVEAEGPVLAVACGLEIRIYGGRGQLATEPREIQTAPVSARQGWPVQIGLLPQGADASRLWGLEVRALAFDDQGDCRRMVLSRSARGTFLRGQVKLLRVLLESSCLGVDCSAAGPFSSTCLGGACLPVPEVRVEDLPDWSGGLPDAEPAVDAAPPSDTGASMDAGRRDAGTVDGAVDDGSPDDRSATPDGGDGAAMDGGGGDDGATPSDGGGGDGASSMDAGGGDAGAPSDAGSADGGGPGGCTSDGECDDAAACTDDRCELGVCVHVPYDDRCDDGIPCTSDQCSVPTGCVHVPDDASCGAGLTCDPGVGCTGGSCRTASDCDDGDLCTTDQCTRGTCRFVPLVCGDGNVCTDDVCVAGSCMHPPNAASCDDGNACTIDDRCSGGTCGAGGARNCDDMAVCTTDSCVPATGCHHDPVGDGLSCGVHAACVAGRCECSGSYADCTAAPGCETDLASDPLRCGSCTTPCPPMMPSCVGGMCTGGADGGGGTDGSRCSDSECSIGGACWPASAQNPLNQCEVCNPSISPTSWSARSGSCDDGFFCTTPDMCMGSFCTGGPRICTGPCGAGTCNESLDACDPPPGRCEIGGVCYLSGQLNPANACEQCQPAVDPRAWRPAPPGSPCNDGLACTTGDQCSGTDCQGIVAPLMCAIDGACWAHLAPRPGHPCQRCESTTPLAWSNLPDGSGCPGAVGMCVGGECT